MSLGAPGGVMATSRRSLAGLVAKGKGANGITRGAARGGGKQRGWGCRTNNFPADAPPARGGVAYSWGEYFFTPHFVPSHGDPVRGGSVLLRGAVPAQGWGRGGVTAPSSSPPGPAALTRSRFGVVCNHKAGEIWLRVKFARCRVSGHFILIKCSGAKSLP